MNTRSSAVIFLEVSVMNEIIEYYNNYNEEKRLSSKSHLPEYLTTMRYIKKYLFPGAKIIEIGAGTGRYSVALAEMGYDVTAVELVKHNIDIMKRKIKPEHNIKIYEGNAVDLSFIESGKYDIVLLLGPMYHLFSDEDKNKAISEALRIAKKGGIVFASYCNNDTCVYKFFANRKIVKMMEKGFVSENFRATPKHVFELYKKPDIDELMKSHNVTRLHFVGVDMLSYIFDERFDKLSRKEFSLYMDFLETICEREDLVGFSIHMLDIFRKEDEV